MKNITKNLTLLALSGILVGCGSIGTQTINAEGLELKIPQSFKEDPQTIYDKTEYEVNTPEYKGFISVSTLDGPYEADCYVFSMIHNDIETGKIDGKDYFYATENGDAYQASGGRYSVSYVFMIDTGDTKDSEHPFILSEFYRDEPFTEKQVKDLNKQFDNIVKSIKVDE